MSVVQVKITGVTLGSGSVGTGRYTYKYEKTNKTIKREFVYHNSEEKKEYHKKMGTVVQIIASNTEICELGV
ncbi:MAG: hypothetical protein GY799_00510 [Desulfobulbaceae bacterium]|nr:hypothetical protein [Desulfobulbaceae bacterium]